MKIVLKTNNHLGDAVILTAVLENLKTVFQDRFEFAVETNYSDVFENNPNVSKLQPGETATAVECVYHPFSQRSGNGGNCILAFTYNAFLALNGGQNPVYSQLVPKFYFDLPPRAIEGDYCVLNANCQTCSEVKAWPWAQKLVDSRKDVKFVQIGGKEGRDVTTDLKGVADMRGKTNFKELVSLVAHSKWVVSPPSAVTHIAAAFPKVKNVVMSGAREPMILTKYPNTIHITSVCNNFNCNMGCMKFYVTRHDSPKCCGYRYLHEGREYANCMADVKPEQVAMILE